MPLNAKRSTSEPATTPGNKMPAIDASPATFLRVPAQLLLAAAQFASKPNDKGEVKPSLCQVNIRRIGDQLAIRSTNGVMAFRCDLSSELFMMSEALSEIQIPVDCLVKPSARSEVAEIIDGHMRFARQRSLPHEIRPIHWGATTEFPKLDALWPDEFDYDPGDAIRFDAKLLMTASKVFAQLDEKHRLILHSSKPNQPVQLSGTTFACNNEVPFDILLMPMLLRDAQSSAKAERVAEQFNAKPEADRDGFRAEVGTGDSAVDFLKGDLPYFSARTISQAAAISTFIAGS